MGHLNFFPFLSRHTSRSFLDPFLDPAGFMWKLMNNLLVTRERLHTASSRQGWVPRLSPLHWDHWRCPGSYPSRWSSLCPGWWPPVTPTCETSGQWERLPREHTHKIRGTPSPPPWNLGTRVALYPPVSIGVPGFNTVSVQWKSNELQGNHT